MDRRLPDDLTVRAALALAVRAPSVHNTQPWRWRIGDRTIHLYADSDRQLHAADPDQRDLMLSCGAALHHLRVAFAALGWSTTVHRFPDRANPDHVASVELSRHSPTDDDIALAAAISRRRSDRRHYSARLVSDTHIRAISAAVDEEGAVLHAVGRRPGLKLDDVVFAAARAHANQSNYLTELVIWSGRHCSSEGVPARNATVPGSPDAVVRSFAAGTLEDPVAADETTGALLVISTNSDDRLARLRAGEATSAALLSATSIGLATCPITEPLEIAHLRSSVRKDVIGKTGFPQMILRVGWAPIAAAPLPETPRRNLDDVIDRL